MKSKKRRSKQLKRGIVRLLVAALIVSHIAPTEMLVLAAEDDKVFLQEQEMIVETEGMLEQTTETESTESVTVEEETEEQATEAVTKEEAEEQTTEVMTEEETEEQATEAVTKEETEEQTTEAVMEEETEEQTTEAVTEEETEEQTTEVVTKEETEEQTTEVMTEEETEEQTTEVMTEEETEEQVTELATEMEVETGEILEDRVINMAVNGVLITVSGKIPAEAVLQVEAKPLEQQVKEEIVKISDMVDSVDELDTVELLYNYDISILNEGEEYEPYIKGEELEVRFTYMSRSALADLDRLEVYHVSNQNGVEQVNVTEMSDYEVVIKADEFSQYVVIGQVEHQYQTYWELLYQESTQNFTAPAKGVYKIELYGAQGADYGSYKGGLGGMVTAYIELDKNQAIEIITGGQNSFHGGNSGTVSNGGGATELRVAGEMVAIAGGGGGAGTFGEGGKGGLSTEIQEIGKTGKGIAVESFGGGAGYQNGQDGYVLMHEHVGDAVNGGGCYTKTSYIYHSHGTSGCQYVQKRCTSTSYIKEGWWPQVQGENPCEHVVCRGCGAMHTGPRDGSAGFDTSRQCGNVISQYWGCGKTENALDGVEFALGCEKDETTVDGMVMSTGGSNYYQTQICKNVATAAGANAGNGRAVITLEEIDAATIYYYESASKLLTSISVEKGAVASYPVTETPQKAADSKYAYTFIGWDNMATQAEEILQPHETVMEAVEEDRSYMAVYEKTPQSYMITLDQAGADIDGTQEIVAYYGGALPTITIPQKKDYIFAGFYTGKDGSGTRIYREDGTGEGVSDFEQNATLYAYWIAPLGIALHPTNVTVQAGYPFAVMETEAVLAPVLGYSLSYQWYVRGQEEEQNANKIEGATGARCTIPTGYQVGTYYIYCEITATSAYNAQQVSKRTDAAKFTVEKGKLEPNQLMLKTEYVVYDGKPHTTELAVQEQSDMQVYYSNMPLTKDNYQSKGSIVPLSYTNAGTYSIYLYVTSTNYQDYAGMVTLTIEKAMPRLYLASRNVTYNKKQQGIGNATVYGINQTILDSEVAYVYYTDEACIVPTTQEDGAVYKGGEPSKIGTYYVQANVEETANYKSAALTQPVMFNIIATKSKFHVMGYHGVYDGKAHGIQIEVEEEGATTFWFSDKVELTKDNYQEEGTTIPYMYTKPGMYTVNYIAVTKITGWIYDYATGSAKVVIEKVPQNGGNGNDGGTQGETTPPSNNQNGANKPLDNVVIPEVDTPMQPQLPVVPDEVMSNESEVIFANLSKDTLREEAAMQESKLLMIMDCLDELTPQELELLRNYLEELHPSMQEQEEGVEKKERTIAVMWILGLIFGMLLGIGIMFAGYPFVHLLLMKRCCVRGRCIERAQHMKLSLETSKGIQKVEKKKNGTFCLSKLQHGETYLLRGTMKNGKTMVLMRIRPQTWNIHYELTEIAGLQMQVKAKRGGLKIQIR